MKLLLPFLLFLVSCGTDKKDPPRDEPRIIYIEPEACSVTRDDTVGGVEIRCGDESAWVYDGTIGEKGDKGETGAAGANGRDGQNGEDGEDYTPEVTPTPTPTPTPKHKKTIMFFEKRPCR